MSKTVVVTGANRGIGLSFCRQLSKQGANVFAVCRQASTELKQLNVTIVDGVDVSQPDDIVRLGESLVSRSIDLLINNAGILSNEVLGQIDYDAINQQFQVNAIGPLRVTEALMTQLNNDAKVAMITSRMGSIADNSSGGRYGYRMSKAALNIAAVSLAKDLAARGIAIGIYHPGLVATEMIGGHGDITPDQAAERLLMRIDELTPASSGEIFHSNGEPLPW